MTLRFYVHAPAVVLRARLNLASATYPIDELPYDGVTEGDPVNVGVGMTVLLGSTEGGDQYGRQRIRDVTSWPSWPSTATGVLRVGRSSNGGNDGELSAVDNAYITVLRDYRVWAKVGWIGSDGRIFKDVDGANREVGDNYVDHPPVANAGAPAAGNIDGGTSKLRVELTSSGSFATADGASISSRVWSLPTGVTLVAGYNLTDTTIRVDCDPGLHWIGLAVTDSNSKTHETRTWVYARNPANDTCVASFEVTRHTIRPEGQELAVRVLSDIPTATYPEGTLVALFDDEMSSPTDRTNLWFWGWHQRDPASIRTTRTGTLREVTLECVDVAGRLRTLPGFSQVLISMDLIDAAFVYTTSWAFMTNPNMDKLLHYLLHWHSTALELTDWQWTGTGSNYVFPLVEAGASNLYEMVDAKARSMVPDYRFTCDRLGRLWVKVDPMMQATGSRTATVQGTLLAQHWSEIRYARQRPPRAYQLRESALFAHGTNITPLYSIAPGTAPGQGVRIAESGEQLARSQDELNTTCGMRYARLNARQTLFEIVTSRFIDTTTFDPAAMTWVNLEISADVAAQRGLTFTAERGLAREMTISYQHTRAGLVRTVRFLWERETSGPPGVTATAFWDV